MPNPFIHVELNTTDLRKAKAFYGKLFSWKLKDMKMGKDIGTYTTIAVGSGTGGGMMKQMMPKTGSAWMPYVLVKDLAAYTKKAKKLGAKILKECENVKDMGSLSIIVDPTGALLGLWQASGRG